MSAGARRGEGGPGEHWSGGRPDGEGRGGEHGRGRRDGGRVEAGGSVDKVRTDEPGKRTKLRIKMTASMRVFVCWLQEIGLASVYRLAAIVFRCPEIWWDSRFRRPSPNHA